MDPPTDELWMVDPLTQYPSSSLLTESQQGSALSSVQWNVGKSLWAKHPFLLAPKDKAPRKEDSSFYFPFALCPSFSFLPGMWARYLEAVQPFWNHKDQSHTLWMGKKKEDAWIRGNLGWHWSTQLWTFVVFIHSLFVECSVPCSRMPSQLMYHSHIAFIFSLVAQTVKCLPTMWETWVQPLGWQDLLEKEMATHSSILAWKIPWMEKPGRP